MSLLVLTGALKGLNGRLPPLADTSCPRLGSKIARRLASQRGDSAFGQERSGSPKLGHPQQSVEKVKDRNRPFARYRRLNGGRAVRRFAWGIAMPERDPAAVHAIRPNLHRNAVTHH